MHTATESLNQRVERALRADYPDVDATVVEAAVRLASRQVHGRDVAMHRFAVERSARALLGFADD